jgi:hypothetical protein
MCSGVLVAAMLAASSVSADESPLTIGQLLGQGWEIAGYASGYDNRTSLILFRKPGINALEHQRVVRRDAQSADRRELLRAAVRTGLMPTFPKSDARHSAGFFLRPELAMAA